jgi:hypothetical protein
VAVHPDDGNLLYAATEVGVFASDDFGAHWSTSNDGPANVVCEEITFAHGSGPRRLVLATLGRGLWTAQVTRPLAVPFGSACTGHASPPQLLVDALAPARIGRTMTFRGANLRTGQGAALRRSGSRIRTGPEVRCRTRSPRTACPAARCRRASNWCCCRA